MDHDKYHYFYKNNIDGARKEVRNKENGKEEC